MKRQTNNTDSEPVQPTPAQLKNSSLMGWEYAGDGLFEKDDSIGWFTENDGFQKA